MRKLVYADDVIDSLINYYDALYTVDVVTTMPDANTDIMVELAKIAQKIGDGWYVPVQKAMELLQL